MKSLPLLFALCLTIVACGGAANTPPPTPKDGPRPDFGADKVFAVAPTNDDLEAALDPGRGVFGKYNCMACHSLGDRRDSLNGPPLGKAGARYLERHKGDARQAAMAIFNHIRDPKSYPGFFHRDPAYAGQAMPPYTQISDDELRLLSLYLLSRQ